MQMLLSAGMSVSTLAFWILQRSADSRRKRLNAWRLWYEFCEDRHITTEALSSSRHPNFFITDFILYLCDRNISADARSKAKSSAIYLVEQISGGSDLGKERLVKDFQAQTATSHKPRPRYSTIWDLNILLEHIRRSPPLTTLPMSALISRAFALLMIFAMARPVEIFRIDVDHIIRSNQDTQWTIPTHRKTDKGIETSLLTIMALTDKTICPVAFFQELLRRSTEKDLPLFHWDNGSIIKSVASISNELKKLLLEAGIPKEFKPYSIRHAAITKLYSIVKDPIQVNTFTGHSQRSKTSAKFYLHQQGNWLGFRLADAPPSPSPIMPLASNNSHDAQNDSSSEDDSNPTS
jgi:integrase